MGGAAAEGNSRPFLTAGVLVGPGSGGGRLRGWGLEWRPYPSPWVTGVLPRFQGLTSTTEPSPDGALMSKFPRFGNPQKIRVAHVSTKGDIFVDWKDVENLRRMMSPNGKILGRKRLDASAREQRMLSQAIKRARFMALLPYTSATL